MDLLVEQGLASVGYANFGLDGASLMPPQVLAMTDARPITISLATMHVADAWSLRERRDNALVPDETKFGSGIPALATYAHKKGIGRQPCSWGCYQGHRLDGSLRAW